MYVYELYIIYKCILYKYLIVYNIYYYTLIVYIYLERERETYFRGLAHMIAWASKFKILRAGWCLLGEE